ncbi:hypothetical protein AGOR_G00239090 [Albula goreensis]|uniref:TLC domain-containing protein n=1 Tax=Albula goreensis TaxID=1534307 RepID=A0A8T3CIE3_9TELE|nr:hypothetical protein AGOR_G00239090 [Albula goreensis]
MHEQRFWIPFRKPDILLIKRLITPQSFWVGGNRRMDQTMVGMLDQWLWRAEYWLPPGITWDDMQGKEGAHYPLPRDLLLTFPLALVFIALRYVFERLVALPLGRWMGVRDRTRVLPRPSPHLELFYTQHSRQPSQSEIISLTKQCDLTQRQLEVHLLPVAFTAGLAVLIDAPWFWDQRECWNHYPKQPISQAHYWYYLLELGFYWSLLLCVSVDIKRKDFKEQIIHHVATISLLGFSYCANYVRIGTLVMLVHDSSDFLLESAKMFNYAGWRICDALFVVFATAFLVTRLMMFPTKIIYTTLILSMEVFEPFFGYYFFNALLLVLQALHIFWAWLILRMVFKFIFQGTVEKDERSDEDSEEEEESDKEEDGEEEKECCWGKRKDILNTKLTALTNNCVLNNLTNQRSSTGRIPKSR